MALFKRAYLLFLASALALPETSCIFDDLEPCEDANIGFSITNNWGTDTSASPEGMAYLFFYDSGCEPWRFDFPGKEAGQGYTEKPCLEKKKLISSLMTFSTF